MVKNLAELELELIELKRILRELSERVGTLSHKVYQIRLQQARKRTEDEFNH